jgi:hypothetical protein
MSTNEIPKLHLPMKFEKPLPDVQSMSDFLTKHKIKNTIVSVADILVKIGGYSFFYSKYIISNGGYMYFSQDVTLKRDIEISQLKNFADVYTYHDLETWFEMRDGQVKFNFERHMDFDDIKDSKELATKFKHFAKTLSKAMFYCQEYGFEIGSEENFVLAA